MTEELKNDSCETTEVFTPLFQVAIEKVNLSGDRNSPEGMRDKRTTFREEMAKLGWYERISNLYRIKGKLDGDFGAFKLNEEQDYFLKNRTGHDSILKSRQAGFCLDPETKILTADLRWICIKDAYPGLEIIAVDEEHEKGRGKSRYMRTAKVQGIAIVYRKAFKISFDDGRQVICTEQHPWLSKKKNDDWDWRSIECKRDRFGKRTKKKLQVGDFVKWITKPWGPSTYEDGWFGGILDGEGSMSKNSAKKSPGITVHQRKGLVWDRMRQYAESRGYTYGIEKDEKNPIRKNKFGKVPVPNLRFTRSEELFRLIGQTRPSRFIDRRFWEGRWLPGRRNKGVGYSKIVSIEPLEFQSMIDLQTSTGTYIAEGFVSHNTTLMCLYAYDRALWDGWVTGIMSHIKERTQKIFEIVSNANDWFKRDWGKLYSLTEETSSANQLSFLENKGSVMVSYDFQSLTMKFLHISEAAFIDDDRIENSLQSVPENGEVCLESTANGCGGFFYDQWQLWNEVGLGAPYKGFFFPWFNHYPEDKDRWINVVKSTKLNFTDREEELIKNYNVTPESLCWRRWKIMESFKGDEDRFEGQYPSDDRTCFLTGENPVFPASVLKYQNAYVKPASLIGDFVVDDEGRISFKESRHGLWRLWDKPNVNSSYVFGVDCSEGIGKDAGVISGWNRKTGYQVCELTAQLVPEELASEAFKVLKYYNMAWVCPEINNHGLTFVTSLVNKGYSRIYKRTVLDELSRKNTQKLGWYNTNARKIDVTNMFLEKCRYGQISVRSETLLKQMSTFIQSSGKVGGTLKREARAGCHDDNVIAACLAWEMDSSLGVSHDSSETWLNNLQENTVIDPETGFVVPSEDESPFHDS